MAPPQQVPVAIFGDDLEALRYWLDHREVPPPELRWLDPATQVIVERMPGDEPSCSWHNKVARPQLPEDLDRVLIRPARKRFRPDKILEVRLKQDLTVTEWVRTGQADPRCKACQRFNRLNRRAVLRSQMSPCRKHGGFKQIEKPHPHAGEVICRISTVKLYGLPPRTKILYPSDEGWARAIVYEYELWREQQRSDAKKLRKKANDFRRFMRRATRYERLLQDDGWLKAEIE
jgi:hypothetical protein